MRKHRKIKSVFLDLDGVLVDFVGGAHKHHNLQYSYKHYPYKLGMWDFVSTQNIKMSKSSFWNSLDREFWSNLDWMHDGFNILTYVEQLFGIDNICILTTPLINPESILGKIDWIKKEMYNYERKYLIGCSKELCAYDGALLIDDNDKNVNKFKKRGGDAVLVPRPWNSLFRFMNTPIQYMCEEINSICKK